MENPKLRIKSEKAALGWLPEGPTSYVARVTRRMARGLLSEETAQTPRNPACQIWLLFMLLFPTSAWASDMRARL